MMNNLQSSAFVAKTTQLLSSVARLRLLLVMLLTLTASTAWGADETATFIASSYGWNDGEKTGDPTTKTVDDITFEFAGGSTKPTYYDDNGLRTYEGCKITISSEATISSIVFTYTISNNGSLSATPGTWNSSTKEWSGSANTVTFTVGHSSGTKNGQIRITQIAVTYIAAASDPCTVTFNAGSGTCDTKSLTEDSAGAGVTLPPATIDCGDVEWTFAGWAEASVATETEEAPKTLYEAGDTYKPTSNITLYAVYKRTEEGEGGGSTPTEVSKTYTFSDYEEGEQYAEETYELDDAVTINIKGCHINTQLRVYGGQDGTVISNELPGRIVSMGFNMGYKADALVVYGSTNGSSWTEVGNISTTTSYKDYTLDFGETNYTYFKLNVEGSSQIRIASMSITWESTTSGGTTTTTYYYSNPDCTTETVITLHPNGGTIEDWTFENGVYKLTTEDESITLPAITRAGYTFANWNTKENGTGTSYNDKAIINNLDGTPIDLYAQWTCETPVFDIKIKDDNPVVFSGESIELTVVGSNIADDATYQWYKKNGESYDELAGETTDKLTIAEATANDAGNYKCVVTNGTCSAENNYTVKMYSLRGLTDPENSWTTDFVFSKAEGKTATYEITLNGASNYKFKVHDGSAYYGNNEGGDNPNPTMTHDNCTNWTMQENKGYNVTLQTTAAGTYTFTLDYTDASNPTISVTYPAKRIVYLNPNPDVWANDNPKFAVHAWHGSTAEDILMTKIDDCNNRNIYFAEIDAAHTHVIFIRGNKDSYDISNPWNNVWNQTKDLTLISENQFTISDWGGTGEWNGNTEKSSGAWENFTPNYTVTFDANGHGTDPDVQCVAKNGKATTPAAPTATGYTFGGWYKDADCTNAWDFANDVVTEDITLYAKWTVKSYTVTWDPAGGNWASNTDNIVQTYEYGAKINAPDKPTYDCHEFAEWTPTYNAEMTMPDEDLVFTATWNKLSYNITFQNWDGSELQSSTVECGETPSYTGATPTREQTAQYTYTFKGWSPTIASVTKDQVYTAQFNQTTRSYTVIWYDGTGNVHKTQTANYNATVALPTSNPDPCDNDYPYFIGWTADPIVGSTTTQPALVENVKVTGDCDYYAVFAKGEAGENGSYTLDYTSENLGSSNKWGSYGTAYEHTAKDGSTWVIKAYKNSGMQINTGKNASIKIPTCPSPITSIEVTGTASKAVGLSASDYNGSGTITYIASGTDATNQTLDLSEETVTGGYIVAKSGSISITKVIVNFGAQTEYTGFITTCCTSWAAPTLTYPTELEENGTAMPQLGAGTTHGTVTYASSNPSILSVNPTTGQISAQAPGTATVTATWSGDETYCSVSYTSNVITVKGSFSVIFEANGGTGTMANQKADENNNIAQLNANQFTRTGYVFVGWNTSISGTGTAYTDQQTNITLAQNLTLYAQWAPVVTLNDAGNEETDHPTAVNGTITLPDGANACSPYEFVGWTSVATADWNGGIEEPALVTSPYKPTAPITLYAVYKIQDEGNPNAFKLSYDLSGTTWYVGTYGNSPYIKAYSNITADNAVTFYKEKIENNTEKYWVYFERYNSYYDDTTKEYLYLYDNKDINTTNSPNETQGWIITKLADGTYEFQSIGYLTKYLSFTDSGSSTDHTVDTRKTFNLLPAVSSTYYAIPDCDVEIKITFETGNGDFIANTPATNPLVVTPGETITLPTCDYPGDGIEFIGWLKNTPQEELSDIIAEVYYEGGEEYVVNDTRDVIFYAYYKVTPEEVEFTGQDDAELKIYHYDEANDNYIYATSFELSKPDSHDDLNYTELCLTSTTWTFTNVGFMQYYIQNEEGLYLGAYSDSDNDFTLLASPSVWNFTNVDGLWKIVCENSPSRAIMYNPYLFTNCHIQTGENNSNYSYVKIGICPSPTYTTNPVLSQGFSITNTAMVTSAVGQKVKAASALTLETRNIELPCTFTIAAPNITFYDNTGAEVTQLTASAASEQFELHFAYKPTAENTMEYPTITITDDEMKTYTIKNRIYARSLPATFAIVAKVGNLWYALPSQGLNSTTPPAAYPIEVDNMADPTAVTAVPENADWSLRGVYEASRSDATKDRYVANGDNLVFVNNASPAMTLNASSSEEENYLLTDAQYNNYYSTNPGLYEWTPTTTDLETYQLTNEQRSRTLSVNIATVFGVHAQDKAVEQVRFLPITGRYTPAALQVVEWKENSVVIMYNGDPAQTASVSVNGATAQNTTLSAAQRDIAVYELAANGLAANPTQRLSITIGAKKVILSIPYIIGGSKNDIDVLSGTTVAARQEVAKVADLVVLKDAKLTAAGAKSNPYKFRNVTIYGGGKLVIPSEKGFGVSSLTMRVGTVNDDGSYTNSYPQLVLNGTINTGNINVDYLTTYDRYYALSLPYEVNTTSILYPADIYGDNLKDGGNNASFALQYYDGDARAHIGKGWKDLGEPADLVAYKGYTFWGAPRKVKVNGATEGTRQKYGIHRIPITETASDLMKGEKSLDDNGNVVARTIDIYAHPADRPNDMGWNFLGNPYLAQYGGLSAEDEDVQVGLLEHEMVDGKWTGGWKHTGNLRYVTTTTDGQNYTAVEVDKATFSPFNTFFIQAATDGALSFAWASRAQSLPARHYAAQQETVKEITTGIILTGNDQTDRTGLLIADNFTEEYDFNADLSKFENSGINLYTIGKTGNLAYMAINQTLAEQPIPVGYTAPAEGLYTIAFDEDRYNATDISALYLIDYDSNEKTNLLHTDYSFVTAAGTNNQRFALQVAFAPANATNIEWVGDGTVQVGVEGNTLMLNNLPTDAAVHVFDALGRLMYHAPTVPTEMQLTLPTGYYLVRIADKQHAVVIKTVIP